MEVDRHTIRQFGKIVSVLDNLETTLDEKDEEAKQRTVLQDLFKEMEQETPKWALTPDTVEVVEVRDDSLPLLSEGGYSYDDYKNHKLVIKKNKKRKASNKKKTPYSKEVVEVCREDLSSSSNETPNRQHDANRKEVGNVIVSVRQEKTPDGMQVVEECDDLLPAPNTQTGDSLADSKNHKEEGTGNVKSESDDFTCEDCELSFKSEKTLKNHQIKYRCGTETFKQVASSFYKGVCELCGFTTSKLQHYRNHACVLNPRIKCEGCSYTTRLEHRMEMHLAAGHHGSISCSICEYQPNNIFEATSRYLLEKHMQEQHSIDFDYPCAQCDFQGTNANTLKHHFEKTHKVHKCEECNVQEKSAYRLKQHIAKFHDVGKVHCALCDFKAASKYLVEKHQKKDHLEDCFYSCDKCGYKGNSAYMLNKHLKAKH